MRRHALLVPLAPIIVSNLNLMLCLVDVRLGFDKKVVLTVDFSVKEAVLESSVASSFAHFPDS